MKVSELITQLQKFDPEFEVVVLSEVKGMDGCAWTDSFEAAQYEDTEFVYLEPKL